MADIKQQVEQATSNIEKTIAEQATRFEGAIAELAKLQTKGLTQVQAYFDDAARLTKEQLTFAEQLAGEWRKTVLATVKATGEKFAPKA